MLSTKLDFAAYPPPDRDARGVDHPESPEFVPARY
jgi:hypothetical protein